MTFRISQRGKEYLETARTLLRTAQSMTDRTRPLPTISSSGLRKLRMLMRPKHWPARLLALIASCVHDLMGQLHGPLGRASYGAAADPRFVAHIEQVPLLPTSKRSRLGGAAVGDQSRPLGKLGA
jgi:hypothetical protein